MIIKWSEENKKKVMDRIEKFIFEHNVTCSEAVHQCDGPNIDSVEVMADIVDIVVEDEGDEEDK